MRAHVLKELTGKSLAVCLSRSWAIERLIRRMNQGIVTFAYERVNGSLRKARGTLKGTEELIKGTGLPKRTTIAYYDVDSKGFRSFRIDHFVTSY